MSIIQLQSIIPELPESGGFILKINGVKPKDLVVKQIRLKINGDGFWKTLSDSVGSKVIATFKLALHPISLCPDMLNPNDLKGGITNVEAKLVMGTTGKYKLKKKSIVKRMNAIIQQGDPPLELEFEYGEKKLMWTSAGVLFRVTTKVSDIINAASSNTSLLSVKVPVQIPQPSKPVKEEQVVLTNQEMRQTIRKIVKVFPTLKIDSQLLDTEAKQTIREKARQNRVTIVLTKEELKKVELLTPEQSTPQTEELTANVQAQRPELTTEDTTAFLSDLIEAASTIENIVIPDTEFNDFEASSVDEKVASSIPPSESQSPKEDIDIRKWKKNSHNFNSTDHIKNYYKSSTQ